MVRKVRGRRKSSTRRSGYGRSEGWKEVTSRWAAGGACWEEEGRDKGDVDGGLLLLTNLRVSLPGW